MGIQDFEAMYDTIDLKRKGYITADQIHKFCETLYYSPLCVQHVEYAIRDTCGASGMVTRQEFLDVFVEIERRRATEEQAYWDFQALDYTASHRISLRDALLLFREVHGDRFSLATWRHFLSSRESPSSDVYFDEIRFWLCSLPSGNPCTDKELKEEENKLLMRQNDYAYDQYSYIRAAMDDEKEKDDHEDEMTRHAQRKLNKWNSQGLKEMLFDDGQDVGLAETRAKLKGQLSLSHISELIERKYKTLQEKLMQEMAKNAAAMPDEQSEMLQQIHRGWKNLLKLGQNFNEVIPGGHDQLLSSLTGLMGEIHQVDLAHRKQVEEMKVRLRSEGKNQQEISVAIQELYQEIISGENTYQAVLLQINKRFHQEREMVNSTLHKSGKNLSDAIQIEYCRLMRQLLVLEEETNFVTIATAVGLSEREMEARPDRYDWDRSRSERLAQFRLEAHKGMKLLHSPDTLPDEDFLATGGVVDLQVELVKEATQKHFYEREAMIHLLLSNESRSVYSKVRKMKPDERKLALKSLQTQHKNWKSNPKADKSVLHTLLKEALWLRYEERRLELEIITPNMSSEEMCEVLLADLQQMQGLDCQGLIQMMQNKKKPDLILLLKKECKARLEETYENIVYIVLGTLEVSPGDEEHMKALEEKYNALRKRIFFLALREEHGSDWKEFSLEEKQSAMRDLMKKEKVLRSESRMTEMVDLIGPKGRLLPSLHSLMGEEKAEYQRRQAQNAPSVEVGDQTTGINVLADLLPRCDNEQEYLLRWLQSPEAKGLTMRMKNMTLVELKIETLRVEMEEDFEIAAISAGLMERIGDSLTKRPTRDEDRQTQLSRKRVQHRQRRLIQMEEYKKEPEIEKSKIPKKGDITGLQVVYLQEMLKRHQDERELILSHLQDDSTEDLIDAAKTMTDEDRQKRLAELQGKRQNLDFSYPDDQEVNLSILEEAAAIQTVCTMEQLGSQGQSTTMESVTVALLADLQDEQDKELGTALRAVENMDEDEMRQHLKQDLESRRDGRATNVFMVLTRYSGEAQDEELIKALEAKYQVLREKLLVDSLVGRIGSDQWQALSYQEKQQKLHALDAQAKEQEKIGMAMPALLGDGFHLKEGVSQLMGVSLHIFRNKVKGQIDVGNHMNLHLEEYQGAVRKKNEPENPLKDLHQRMEEEKNDLIKHLKGQSDEYFSENDRQLQLLCYKRERKLASGEEGFNTAATLIGILERQQEEIRYRLLKDKERYENLARQEMLIIERRKERLLSESVSSSRDFMTLMESVLNLLEGNHIQERKLFFKLLADSEKMEDLQQIAALSSQQQRLDNLAELREARKKSVLDKNSENISILTEATVFRKEGCRSRLTADGRNLTFDDLGMTLMAELLEYQNSEAQRILTMLVRKSEDDISKYQHKILQDRKSNMADNIALVVFSPERTDGTTESDLIEALKGKYDALKDKLLAEALIKQLGESNWNRMSETERQKKIFQLKLKERQLRKEGRVDEANALLGELLKEQEHLRQLMGDSVEEQRRKFQERLIRRKQRQAAGMSEEEIDRLEKDEIEEEEEMQKRKHRDLLQDLENRFEEEKDELLRRLQNAGDDLERERERQANLARLRRDERLARDEDKFGSAALILGLAEKQDKDLRLSKDEERKRQEKLARERIEAARQRRRQGKQLEDDGLVVVDTEDPASLQEAIARDLDKKHRKELEFFMQLLDDAVSSKFRKSATSMDEDQRDDKLYELSELHKNWLQSEAARNPQEQTDIFMEAAGYLMEVVKSRLEADGQSSTDDDILVALVANLQEAQKREAQRLLDEIENKDLKSLQQLHTARLVVDLKDQHKNIAAVLLGDQEIQDVDDELEGETSEAKVLSALEQKYDAIRDKLLIEALMKEYGEREWAEMTEKQRQKKLIELKVKERQLRKEGKMLEIANIIGSHLENEKLLDELFGGSKKSQQERLNERLARKKQLIAERRASGLNTDEATINAIIEDEEIQEEKRKRRNILEDLQKNFDDEKAALLKSLARQTDKVAQERQRQIEIAKLKRDQRQLKKDEKLDVVAMMIQSAKQDDKKREEGILAERERQRAIAKERLAARRQKKYKTGLEEQQTAEQLMEEEENSKMEDIVKDAQGRSVQEALLMTVERRQEEEMDLMMGLLEGVKTQQHLVSSAQGKEDQELKSELTKLEHDQLRWRKKSKQAALSLNEDSLTEEQGRQHMSEVAERRSNHLKLLMDAMVYRLEIERRMMINKFPELQTDNDRLEEELMVVLVTDLQEKQTSESNAIQKIIEIQDDDVILEMKKSQHVACREGWFDNLTRTIFSLSKVESAGEEIDKLEEDFKEALRDLDETFEVQKNEAIENARRNAAEGETVDEEAIIRSLKEQFDMKRQAISDEMSRQKGLIKEKMEAKRLLKENKEYEDLAAKTVMKLAKEQHSRAQEGVKKEQRKQSTLLQQRLAQRREARKVARQTKFERETTLDSFDTNLSKSSDETNVSTPSPFDTSPFGAMRREKTVVDVDVTDEQKQAMYSQLMRQQQQAESKRAQQMMRQEEMLRRRLAARQGKPKDEAAELLSLGQRQKTVLEKTQKDEKDRQLQKIEEKRARMREKRDPSPKVKGKH